VIIRQRRGDPYPDAEFHFLPLDLHLVHLRCAESQPPVHWESGGRCSSTDTEVDSNRGTRLVLRQPLFVRESHEETALAHGRVPD